MEKETEVKNELIEEPSVEMVNISKEEFEDITKALKEGHEKLVESTKINEELNNKYLRALADYQNLQRTSSIRVANSRLDERISVFKDIIPVLDTFENAISSEEVSDGIKLIYNQLKSVLEKYNIKEISSNIGEVFDDSIHEAIAAIPGEEDKKNTIVYVQSKGYKLDDSILRYAKVGVYV